MRWARGFGLRDPFELWEQGEDSREFGKFPLDASHSSHPPAHQVSTHQAFPRVLPHPLKLEGFPFTRKAGDPSHIPPFYRSCSFGSALDFTIMLSQSPFGICRVPHVRSPRVCLGAKKIDDFHLRLRKCDGKHPRYHGNRQKDRRDLLRCIHYNSCLTLHSLPIHVYL